MVGPQWWNQCSIKLVKKWLVSGYKSISNHCRLWPPLRNQIIVNRSTTVKHHILVGYSHALNPKKHSTATILALKIVGNPWVDSPKVGERAASGGPQGVPPWFPVGSRCVPRGFPMRSFPRWVRFAGGEPGGCGGRNVPKEAAGSAAAGGEAKEGKIGEEMPKESKISDD